MLSNQQRPLYLNHAHKSQKVFTGSQNETQMMRGPSQQNGGLADRKPSKLEQMRADYQKKLMKEKEEKMIQMYEDGQKRAMMKMTRNGSGNAVNGAMSPNGKSVREFFNERRRMEAAGAPVPPIDNHYRQARGYNSPGGWSNRTGSGNSMNKVSAGRDRSQPLAPIRRPLDTQEVAANNNPMRSGIPQRQQPTGIPGQGDENPFHGRPRLVKHKPLPPTNTNNHVVDNNNNDGDFDQAKPVRPSNLPKFSPQHRKPNHQPHPPAQPQTQQQQKTQQQIQIKHQQRGGGAAPNAVGRGRGGPGPAAAPSAAPAVQKSQGQEKLTDFQKWQMEQNKAREDRLKKLNTQKNAAPIDTSTWTFADDDDDDGDGNGGDDGDDEDGEDEDYHDDNDDDEDDHTSNNNEEEEIKRQERELMKKIALQQKELDRMKKEREREEEEERREMEKQKKKEAMERARQKKLDEERRKEEERLRKQEEEDERLERQRHEKMRKEEERQRKEDEKQRKEEEKRRAQEEKLMLKRQKEEEKRLAKQHTKSSARGDYHHDSPVSFDDSSPLPSARRTATLPSSTREPQQSKSKMEGGDPDERRVSVSDANFYANAASSSEAKGSTGSLVKCKTCGRSFASDRLKKHQEACAKANKPRKEFDSSKKRVEGTELAKYAGKAKKAEPPKKKSNWRHQHEQFIQSLRYAKKVSQYEKGGGDLRDLTPPPAAENPDFVPCPHCGRTFNETAAERHIPRCQALKTRPPPMNTKRR